MSEFWISDYQSGPTGIRHRRQEDEMADISKSVDINASGNEVFDVLTNLDCLPLWSTITLATHGTPRQPIEEGDTFEQTLRVLGASIETRWQVGELDRPRKVVYRAETPDGGVLRMVQQVRDSAGVSRVEVELEYDLPSGFVDERAQSGADWIDEAFSGRRNERELEHSLHNLKELVEARSSRQTTET
jgi:uncharacterized protein YndB with AHSA1/START domain